MTAQELENIIDFETGLGRIRGNKTLYAKMITLVISSPEFTQLDEALAANEYASASRVAHAIKGMTGNLALDGLFKTSEALMHELNAGAPNQQTVDAYYTALSDFRAASDEIIAILNQK